MSKSSERWAERVVGRPMIRGPNGEYLFTTAELCKLVAPPPLWRLGGLWFIIGLIASVLVTSALGQDRLLDDKGGFLLDEKGGFILAQEVVADPLPVPPEPEILVRRDVLECLNAKQCNGHQTEWITITPDPAIVVPAPGDPHPHITITLTAQNSSYVTVTIGKCMNVYACDFK